MDVIETNANHRFMQSTCEICGGTDIADTALSEIVLTAGYGCKWDGEQVRLTICGRCADKILSIMDSN